MQTTHSPSNDVDYGRAWRAVVAPRTGDIRRDISAEAAEYLGITPEEVERKIEMSATEFPDEWARLVTDPKDPAQVVRFYNESRAELFEQIAWHATDLIHHRSVVCADLVRHLAGGEFLDFGSGIGSNAMTFGLAGFTVTLADVADPLRNFAKWRLEKRGLRVRAIDLKHDGLPEGRFDVITCFDVLEHVPDPVETLRQIRSALKPGGYLFVHAPFGFDPVRPMHIVHDDVARKRIRSLGFDRQYSWEAKFPGYFEHPEIYRRVERAAPANLAYYVRDVWLTGGMGHAISKGLSLVGARGRSHA